MLIYPTVYHSLFIISIAAYKILIKDINMLLVTDLAQWPCPYRIVNDIKQQTQIQIVIHI